MAENSNIEWTTHTFNPWWGCMKVSDGCKNCYAESLDNRYNHDDPHWGPNSPRKPMSDKYWAQPIAWNEAARKAGIKAKIFCASMADWAESQETLKHYPSYLMVQDARLRLFQTIATTPHLIWQLLTKRPDNIMPLIDSIFNPLEMHDLLDDGNKEYLAQYKEAYLMLGDWLNGNPPENVWIGTSVENHKMAVERILPLLQVPAAIRFLSCEPLLSEINFYKVSGEWENLTHPWRNAPILTGIHWVICGGESGPKARPMHPAWARTLRDQCDDVGVSFFFKQWGEWKSYATAPVGDGIPLNVFGCKMQIYRDGEFIALPGDMSAQNAFKDFVAFKVGKKEAGALLDGVEHKEFPV